jgi:hypothetical protein
MAERVILLPRLVLALSASMSQPGFHLHYTTPEIPGVVTYFLLVGIDGITAKGIYLG